jgi:hypothetical protein
MMNELLIARYTGNEWPGRKTAAPARTPAARGARSAEHVEVAHLRTPPLRFQRHLRAQVLVDQLSRRGVAARLGRAGGRGHLELVTLPLGSAANLADEEVGFSFEEPDHRCAPLRSVVTCTAGVVPTAGPLPAAFLPVEADCRRALCAARARRLNADAHTPVFGAGRLGRRVRCACRLSLNRVTIEVLLSEPVVDPIASGYLIQTSPKLRYPG